MGWVVPKRKYLSEAVVLMLEWLAYWSAERTGRLLRAPPPSSPTRGEGWRQVGGGGGGEVLGACRLNTTGLGDVPWKKDGLFIYRVFFGFFLFMYDIQYCSICRPKNSTVSEDAGIEPKTVATTALAVRRSNHLARSHPQDGLWRSKKFIYP